MAGRIFRYTAIRPIFFTGIRRIKEGPGKAGQPLMDIEIVEIRDFLAAHHPFDLLPDDALNDLVRQIEIRYLRRNMTIMTPGEPAEFLYVIRTGAVETRDPDGQLLARLGEGEVCGIRAFLRGGMAVNRSIALEDSLVYLLPFNAFTRLHDTFPQVEYYFAPMGGGRLKNAAQAVGNGRDSAFLTVKIEELLARSPISIDPAATIRAAATRMRDERISSLLITTEDRLVGILTDRDLRSRVVADGIAPETPISQIMTASPISIDAGDYVFDALMTMSRHNIHHLPVVRDGRVAGCITTTDLIGMQTVSPVFLVGDIHKCESAEALRRVLDHVPDLILHLADSGTTAHRIGHVLSALHDAVTERLIHLAETRLGPSPVPYAWLAAGSQGRQEQTARSDQDNVMLLDNAYNEEAHGAYFRELCGFVSDGLNACGYVYCPGETMATTDRWRQPLATWQSYFRTWIDQPEPKALMLCSIFFDLRVVHGEGRLFETLRTEFLALARENKIFQAYMAGNALHHQPPLGFFRNLVLIRGGDHDRTLDLKHTGVVPIIDLARVYALATGVPVVNTDERLAAARAAGAVSNDGIADLRDAFEFISLLRLRHQAARLRNGQTVDNFLEPRDLSNFERDHLKNAFSVVKTMQASLAMNYQAAKF